MNTQEARPTFSLLQSGGDADVNTDYPVSWMFCDAAGMHRGVKASLNISHRPCSQRDPGKHTAWRPMGRDTGSPRAQLP